MSHARRDYAPTRHHVTYRARILALHHVGYRTAIADSRGTAMPDGDDPNRFLLFLLKPAQPVPKPRLYSLAQTQKKEKVFATSNE